MNLTTQYLGLPLENPLILGASPLTHDLDKLLRVVDAGVGAVVMHSLFEEQLSDVDNAAPHDSGAYWRSNRPDSNRALAEYLQQLSQIKKRVSVPVIASLNGVTSEGWLGCARNLEQAGADAIELNVYHLTLDPDENAVMIERNLLDMVREVAKQVRVPVAVKLTPFYAGLPNLARRLVHEGARGLVLFNRFFEPDIDLSTATLEPRLYMSDSRELTMRLRWLAALSPSISGSLAVSGGVHSGADALKAIMAGAHAVQVVSTVLQRGPSAITALRRELEELLTSHAQADLTHTRGCMNLARCPDSTFYKRGNYVQLLLSYYRKSHGPAGGSS